MRRVARLAVPALVMLSAVLTAAASTLAAAPSEALLAELQLVPGGGATPPALSLPDLDGRTVSLAGLRGQVVLVYFWATWCPYCVRELPSTIESLQRRYRDQGLTVLAVNFEERREKVSAWVRARGLSMPVLLDADGDVSGDYRVTATPTAVLLDREGRVVGRAVGTRPWTGARARPLWDALLMPPAGLPAPR